MNEQRLKYVAYYRVSTRQQGDSGLGLEAQQSTVRTYIRDAELLAEYTEIESGRKDKRPQLTEALALCKRTNSTLIIAKLDRLSRNVAFIDALLTSETKFICCDMPGANELMIGFMAQMAQYERKLISERTRNALKSLKERGVRLGGSDAEHCDYMRSQRSEKEINKSVLFTVKQLKDTKSLQEIANELNAQGLTTDRGNEFGPVAVHRIIKKIESSGRINIAGIESAKNTTILANSTRNSYESMIQRCYNPQATGYHNYGGRGITVCERWLGPNGYTNFIADMGYKPDLALSIDKMDNDGQYSPDNCRWATRAEQQKNKRNSVKHLSKTVCLGPVTFDTK